jgi:hypothetical protein
MKRQYLWLIFLFLFTHLVYSAEDTRTGASVYRTPANLSTPGKTVPLFNPGDYAGKYQFKSAGVAVLLDLRLNKQFEYTARLKQNNQERKVTRKGNWILVQRGNTFYIRLLAWQFKSEFRVIKQGGYISLENMMRQGSVYYPVAR